RMEMLLAESRAYVDAIFVCPHHPDRGYEGEVPHLKGPCRCRKPATGLVDDAVNELNIDTSATWLIGDSSTDVACALEAGLIPALVSTGHAGMDGRHPTDYALRFASAKEAIDFAVDVFPSLWRRCLMLVENQSDQAAVRVAGSSRDAADNAARLIALAARRRGKATSITSAGAMTRLAPHGGASDAQVLAITTDVVIQSPSELVIDLAS
ncbi:MAG: HAD hydrolase-like protein, partial [Sphaerospermopsis kisseleviana]